MICFHFIPVINNWLPVANNWFCGWLRFTAGPQNISFQVLLVFALSTDVGFLSITLLLKFLRMVVIKEVVFLQEII